MARTKKFLNSKSDKTGIGFYRPIKRLKKASRKSKVSDSVQKNKQPLEAKPISESQVIDLQSKIQELEDLKALLNKQIADKLHSADQKSENYENRQIAKKQASSNSKVIEKKPDTQKDSQPHQNITIDWQGLDDLNDDLDQDFTDQQLDVSSSKPNQDQEPLNSIQNNDSSEPEKKVQDGESEMLKKELVNLLKERKRYEKEVKALKLALQEEREKMEKTVKSLKKKIDHPNPANHSKFFTISDELGEVVKAMNSLVAQNPEISLKSTAKTAPQDQVVKIENQPVSVDVNQQQETRDVKPSQDQAKDEVKKIDVPKIEVDNKKEVVADKKKKKKGIKIPKPVLVLGITLLIVGSIGGGAWFYINHNSSVDTNLVQEYLPKDQQQNNSDQGNVPANPAQVDQGKKADSTAKDVQNQASESANVKGASDVATNLDDTYKESQANTSFSDTKWDVFSDATFGFELTYPINSVNMVKTDSSVTFLRKTGYIFKVQVADSVLDLDQYWQLVGSGGLKYKSKSTKFRGHEALFLQLDEDSDYPGDRYLVKFNDKIYDIWYATFGPNLSDDDAKRVDIMLNSFKFLEDKNK